MKFRLAERLSKNDWLGLGAITLVVLIFFSPVLFGGYWMPNKGGDLVSFLWPVYSFASRTLKGGELPLWNPHLYGGAPYWADNQSSLLYPPVLLTLLLTDVPYQALEGLVILHVWLAGIAMYICLRQIIPAEDEGTIKPPAAIFGALIWMLSDGFVTHIGNLNLIAVIAWLPLIVLASWRALRDLSWKWALLAGILFGLSTLAGHAQMTYFTVLMIACIGLCWLGTHVWRSTQSPLHSSVASVLSVDNPAVRTTALIILIAVTGLALSAGGWLPALEMAAQTRRSGLTYEDAARFSLPPQALIGLVAPWVYGRGPSDFTGTWDRVEVGYVGVIGLLAALIGAVRAIRSKGRAGPILWFALILGTVSFLLALGQHLPLHRLFYEIVPGFKSFRAPARFTIFFDFAVAVLSTNAIAALTKLGESVTARSKWGFAPWFITVLAVIELTIFGAGIEIDRNDPRGGFQHLEVVRWLQDQPGPFRLDNVAPALRWQPDAAALHGGFYDTYGIPNPLILASYETYYWSVGYRGSPTYNFLGAKYALTNGGPPGDATFVLVYTSPDGLTVFLNTRALPMALLVYQGIPVESQDEAFALIHADDWDARQTVYIEGGPPIDGTPPQNGTALGYDHYGANSLSLSVETPQRAYLVLSEVAFPGWVALVDGKPVPIYRANSAFRAILIEPGKHTVQLVFRPVLVYAGLVISLLAVVSIMGVVVYTQQVKDIVADHVSLIEVRC